MNSYRIESIKETYESEFNSVKKPKHYADRNIEVKDYIKDCLGDGYEDWCYGNALKYLSRYRLKGNPIEDLEKCKEFIDWIIDERHGTTLPE